MPTIRLFLSRDHPIGIKKPGIVTGADGGDIVGTANHLVEVERNPIRFHDVISVKYKCPFYLPRQAG
jgi:hypothetical protein